MGRSPGLELREHVPASEVDQFRRLLLLVFFIGLYVIFVRFLIGKNRDERLRDNVVFDSGLPDSFCSGLDDLLCVVAEIALGIREVLL